MSAGHSPPGTQTVVWFRHVNNNNIIIIIIIIIITIIVTICLFDIIIEQ
jgi:hypothetical protein